MTPEPHQQDQPQDQPQELRADIAAPAGNTRTNLLMLLAIVLGTLASYARVLGFGFVNVDDGAYVMGNPHLTARITNQTLKWIFFSFSPDNWFPLTRISLLVDYKLFGLNAAPYHAENLVLHCAAAWLLFAFLRRATNALWPSVFVTMVFVLHPLHVESVAWVAERKDILCALFWFATLRAWLRYTERPGTGRYVDALLLFSLGLMAKPMIVSLPFLLLLLDVWPLRRGPLTTRIVISRVVEKLPFVALSGAVMAITIFAQSDSGAMDWDNVFPLALRIQNALVTIAIYIADTVWPARLWLFYSYPVSIPAWQYLGAAAGIAAVSLLALLQWKKRPYLLAGWFWFLLTLGPVVGIVQVGPQARADRYMYVPMVGLSIMLAWAAAEAADRWPGSRRAMSGLAVAACMAMAIRTSLQTQYWKDTAALLNHGIEMDSRNYMAMNHLAFDMRSKPDRLAESIAYYRRALAIRPDLAISHNDLGFVLCLDKQWDEGLAEYRQALRINPKLSATHGNIADALMKTGHLEEAVVEDKIALRLNPQYTIVQNNLGGMLALLMGRPEEGLPYLEKAAEIDPDYADAQINMGLILLKMPGRVEESIAHFAEVVRIDPENPTAHLNLARAMERAPGMELEARDQREEAQRLQMKAARQ